MLQVNPDYLIKNLAMIARIFQTLAILIGLLLIVGGILRFKKYGEMRGMMSHSMSIGEPLMIVLAGAGLLTLPWVIGVFLHAFWGTSSPLSMTPSSNNAWDKMITAVTMFVRLVGIGAFIRGWAMIAKSGKEGGAQPGHTGRGLIHIIAGVLCIHILGTVALLQTIMGAG